MNGPSVLLASLALVALSVSACRDSEDGAPSPIDTDPESFVSPTRTGDPSPLANETPWRLIVTRADGRVEVHDSLDQPSVCDSREQPRILFFCGSSMVERQPLPVAWDFLQVNVDAGDTYVIEGSPTPVPIDDGRTPTYTPVGP